MQLRSTVAALALVVLALPAAAQQAARPNYDAFMLPETAPSMGRTAPGIAASSPVAFGPNKGDVFAGFGYQTKSAFGTQDGSISGGMGFFNSETVGLEVVLTSVSTIRSGFGSRMLGALKAHRSLGNGRAIAVGYESIKLVGDGFDANPAFYLVGTQAGSIGQGRTTFNSYSLNLGLGNERYQSAEAQLNGDSGMGVFFAGSVRVNSAMSAILDYTGGQTNIAFSFSPFTSRPIVITTSFNDITGEMGDKARLMIGAGMSWRY
jgi:hypothetical protein